MPSVALLFLHTLPPWAKSFAKCLQKRYVYSPVFMITPSMIRKRYYDVILVIHTNSHITDDESEQTIRVINEILEDGQKHLIFIGPCHSECTEACRIVHRRVEQCLMECAKHDLSGIYQSLRIPLLFDGYKSFLSYLKYLKTNNMSLMIPHSDTARHLLPFALFQHTIGILTTLLLPSGTYVPKCNQYLLSAIATMYSRETNVSLPVQICECDQHICDTLGDIQSNEYLRSMGLFYRIECLDSLGGFADFQESKIHDWSNGLCDKDEEDVVTCAKQYIASTKHIL
jgi:hypothetical protein